LAGAKQISISAPVIIASAAAIIAITIGAYFTFGPRKAPPPPPVLTNEAKQYLPNLKLSDVRIQASDSYINQSLVEIVGKISNTGPKRIVLVEVNCVFRDPSGKEIKRERVTIAGGKTGPLAPADTKTFRMAFDNLPSNWNQAMPDLVIAQIQFSQLP
jgi:hypothetical protein